MGRVFQEDKMSDYIKLTDRLHVRDFGPDKKQYVIYCPGCKWMHMFHVGSNWGGKL